MALIARESGGGGTFTPVPPGMYLARCYRIVDLGTQKSEYLGQIKNLPKVMLQFEVHGEDDAGKPLVTAKGEPMSISKNFTLSLAEKATLRKDLQTWRGKEFTADELRGFQIDNVLGAWAMIAISAPRSTLKAQTWICLRPSVTTFAPRLNCHLSGSLAANKKPKPQVPLKVQALTIWTTTSRFKPKESGYVYFINRKNQYTERD